VSQQSRAIYQESFNYIECSTAIANTIELALQYVTFPLQRTRRQLNVSLPKIMDFKQYFYTPSFVFSTKSTALFLVWVLRKRSLYYHFLNVSLLASKSMHNFIQA